MRKLLISTVTLLTALALVATPATAHTSVYTVKVGDDTYYSVGAKLYKESNDLLRNGVNSFANAATGMRGDTGLQIHASCDGLHTATEIAIWNWHHSHGHFGSEDGSTSSNNEFNYIPFEGTAADCTDLGGTFYPADTSVA